MISLEDALQRILAELRPLPSEPCALSSALRRFPSEPLVAAAPVPAFDNSSVDGYAVRSADVATASFEKPVVLSLVGRTSAGEAPATPLGSGQCRRILTGAPLPPGSDAVVMQEDTRVDAPDRIALTEPVRPWENIRFAGEDFRAGATVVPAGMALRPARLGLAASAGHDPIHVHRRPRLSVFSTGNELRPPGEPLGPGQIHDSNRFLLQALALDAGAELRRADWVPDRLDALSGALREAAQDSDVIVTTGGVSVGDADLLKPAITALGGTVDLWRISLKPGKPFAFGRLGGAFWFGLPGNPVSAFVTWQLLVLPALRRLQGARAVEGRTVSGTLGEPLRNSGDRRHFVRVVLGPAGEVRPAGTQASHLQCPLALADGLVDVPPDTAWPAGERVRVLLLD